jgi:hypothetical protein
VTNGERERASASARKPARPKRRQAAEKAGVESSRRSDPERREAEEAKKTLGDPSMAAGLAGGGGGGGGAPVRPVLPVRDVDTTGRVKSVSRASYGHPLPRFVLLKLSSSNGKVSGTGAQGRSQRTTSGSVPLHLA